MGVYFNVAGRVCLAVGRVHVHLWVSPGNRQWGRDTTWYDGPFESFGLGPFLLVCW